MVRNKSLALWLCHQKWRISSNPTGKDRLWSQRPENHRPLSYRMALVHFYTEAYSLFLKTSLHFFTVITLLCLLFHWPVFRPLLHGLLLHHYWSQGVLIYTLSPVRSSTFYIYLWPSGRHSQVSCSSPDLFRHSLQTVHWTHPQGPHRGISMSACLERASPKHVRHVVFTSQFTGPRSHHPSHQARIRESCLTLISICFSSFFSLTYFRTVCLIPATHVLVQGPPFSHPDCWSIS